MIEEIKNWIDLQKDEDFIEISGKTLYKILDKYNNQPDFKSAFEELKQYNIDLDKTNAETLVKDNSEFYHYQRGFMMGTKNQIIKTKELEQKYNLGGE